MRKIKINTNYSYYLIKEEHNWYYGKWEFKTYFYKKKYELTIFNKTIFAIKKLIAIRFYDSINIAIDACLTDIRDLNNIHNGL